MSKAIPTTPRQAGAAALALLALILLLAPSQSAAVGVLQEDKRALDGFDSRQGAPAPGASRVAARRLGAKVTFNRFGTADTVTSDRGWLATGLSGDPERAARQFLGANGALFGLSAADAGQLEVVNDSPLIQSDAHVIVLRQSFGGLPAVAGGLVSVGVVDGKVAHASSSLARGAGLTGERRLLAQDAWRKAAASVGRGVPAGGIRRLGRQSGFGTLAVRELGAEQQVREAALAMPSGGARRVFEANVVDNGSEPLAFTVYVDAETGEVLRRVNRLENAADQPNWKYFTNNPPLSGAGTDRRIVGCFPVGASPAGPCTFDERMGDAGFAGATPAPWDVLAGAATPTFTTNGNNADTALSAFSPFTPGPDRGIRPTSPTRDYFGPFTNQWQTSRCNPAVFAGGIVPATGPDTFGGTNANDVNAAIISLFANHNNMHDWSYNLGFTEANFNMQVNNFGKGGRQLDPEIGDAQGGSLTGGAPTYTGRDNANQITLQDGVAPITNMYLWQPIGSAFYPPCVDGDFDMSVIGHEYTHAISNRMVAGPDNGLTSTGDGQARAMGESFSDFTAVEFLMEHGYVPSDDENPFTVGAYVTGSKQKGIRNYGMNKSPLNYSNVQGYDGSGMGSPHDDGEIWSAVNYDIRQALLAKYPAGDQLACARGQKPVDECPGNRRWMQLVFDSYLLMPMDGQVSMLEARDALLKADQMRFGGANQNELWTAFARRGFGEKASSANQSRAGFAGDTDDPQPVPSFESPLRGDETTVTFRPTAPDGGAAPKAELFVGDYEAGVTPVADTDPATELDDKVELLPGEYSFVSRADGFGAQKFTQQIGASTDSDLNVAMPSNRASRTNGATTSGDGVNRDLLIDDTEQSNWAVLNRQPNVAGSQVTVDLGGGEQLVKSVNVSALLRARDDGDSQGDTGSQNRFTALRKFEIRACTASAANQQCASSDAFDDVIFTSPDDAFPGDVPRPLAPDMILRSFDVDDTPATHVRMVVLTNQCLGSPVFPMEQEEDLASKSDCRENNAIVSDSDDTVRASELQVFSRPVSVSLTPSPQSGGSGPGGGQPSGGSGAGYRLPGDGICAEIAAFRSVSVTPRGRGARIAFARRRNTPVNVDVFQQSRGERITANRRVASFRGRSRSFTWRGRGAGGKRLPAGRYAVRFRVPRGAGRLDIRHVALLRKRSRFRRRPAFSATGSCGLLNVYRLSGSTFSANKRRLAALFRVRRRAAVSVVVRRGGRVVRRLRTRTFAPGRPFKLPIRSAGLRRGDYRVTVTARSGSERVSRTLVSRRL